MGTDTFTRGESVRTFRLVSGIGPVGARASNTKQIYLECIYTIHMKAVQVTLDEKLLAELDADPEAQRDGRSAVLRRAAREYLARRRREAITAQYREAYGAEGRPGGELEGWEDEGDWPRE